MRTLIAIPSKNRADQLVAKTLIWLTKVPDIDVAVFVEPQDIEQYEYALDSFQVDHPDQRVDVALVSLPENDKGLGYAKENIKLFAEKFKIDLIFKIDDDVSGFNPRGAIPSPARRAELFSAMLKDCEATLEKQPEVAAIGFPYRNELWEPKRWSAINARLQTCYIVRTEYLQGGFDALEDFAQYIYIRSKNKLTLRYGLLGINTSKIGSNKGGLQEFDRQKLTEQEIDGIRKIYPAIKFKQVDGKSWSIEPDMRGEFYGVKAL